jgi:thymidylate kinase
VKPDLTFFIDANADTIKSRSDFGSERYERVEFQKKVSESYGKFKQEAEKDDHWVTVNADGKSIEEMHSEILDRFIKYREAQGEGCEDLEKLAGALFMEIKGEETV